VFLAVLGTPGQLLAILVFVYAGLASAGGTVPLEALPPVFRTISQVEPLRQILSGTRAILYFDARSDAGLTRGLLAAGLGLLFWLIAGTGIIRWYDYKGLDRIKPDLLAYIRSAFQNYRPQRK
jgi:ABC-type multidrug transport system permease subunit